MILTGDRQGRPGWMDAPRAISWRLRRDVAEGGVSLRLELIGADGVRGQACVPDGDGLLARLEHHVRVVVGTGLEDPSSSNGEPSHYRRLARGLVAAAAMDLRCHRFDVSWHEWLGGAIRPAIRVTLPLAFSTHDRRARDRELDVEVARAHQAAADMGISSFAIHDASPDDELIAHTVRGLRSQLGSAPSLGVRLASQLDVAATRSLAARIRCCDVTYLGDPCATVDQAIDATRAGLPALALSAARYDRAALLTCLAVAPPTVLFLDPLMEGGPSAARRLAAIGRVLQVDLALTAEAGGPWLVNLCTALAAVLPASRHPMELPANLPLSSVRELGVVGGVLEVPNGSPLRARGSARTGIPVPDEAIVDGLWP